MPKKRDITGIDDAALAYFLARESGQSGQNKLCFLARDASQLAQLAAEIPIFAPKKRIITLPAWDAQPYDRLAPDAMIQAQRAAAVTALQQGKVDILLATASGAGTKLFPHAPQGVHIQRGQVYKPAQLAADLINLGLTRVETVTEAGEFAQRGAIFDVYPPLATTPYRLDYFDDEIDGLKTFDPLTQRSLEAVKDVSLSSAGEIQLNAGRIQCFREKYRHLFPKGISDTVYTHISNQILPPVALHYLPLFEHDALPSVFDLLPATTQVIAGSSFPQACTDRTEMIADAYNMRLKLLETTTTADATDGDIYRPIPPEDLYLNDADWQSVEEKFAWLQLHTFIEHENMAQGHLLGHTFGATLTERVPSAAEAIMAAKQHKKPVILSAPSKGTLNQLQHIMAQVEAPDSLLNGVKLEETPLAYGFESDTLLMITDQDILGARQGTGRTTKAKRKDENAIANLGDLQVGDYVVHTSHGIGRFEGLVTMDIPHMQVSGKSKIIQQDFIKLHYAASGAASGTSSGMASGAAAAGASYDRVFVPIEALGLISRHSSAEAGTVALDKLGGTAWQARRARIKKDLLEIAGELMKTAAARDLLKKEPLPTPVGLYEDFANTFAYQTTSEQQSAIDAVLDDMAEPHPMDRLVVGDVGFGKTEVALRAAMVAVGNNKQVAIIAPTTLLARQHVEVFSKRFAGFPFNIKPLSRLVSAKQVKETKQDMADGKVDIIIGTHALLAKDIKFKNLGLLVIDEEQRFGVTHKEKLKKIKANVDVLTLTATPIPRTLHMATGGLKRLSTITTPPVDRLAVRTFVLPWDPKTMREAVLRELHRGGQVYIVTPRVQDIPKLSEAIHTLVPEAKVQAAHGQLPERELEDKMDAFYRGEFNVLIATTIIESGLDVPRANTLIVNRADRFGLAQLHQLRGRVGRSTMRAYAYFVLPEGQVSDMAERRLKILQRLEGLGAGFQLASFDMDLRGAGNLLGREQSGHVQDIGFELYTKMLAEAVAELKHDTSTQTVQTFTPQLNLGISYLIPADYMPDLATRMQMYRRLADPANAGKLADIQAELEDRFGALPPETMALFQVVGIRNQCHALNIDKLDVGPKGVVIRLYQNTFAQPEALMQHLQKNVGVISLQADQTLVFHQAIAQKPDALLNNVHKILCQLNLLKKM